MRYCSQLGPSHRSLLEGRLPSVPSAVALPLAANWFFNEVIPAASFVTAERRTPPCLQLQRCRPPRPDGNAGDTGWSYGNAVNFRGVHVVLIRSSSAISRIRSFISCPQTASAAGMPLIRHSLSPVPSQGAVCSSSLARRRHSHPPRMHRETVGRRSARICAAAASAWSITLFVTATLQIERQ
jgi:hypothetical protein